MCINEDIIERALNAMLWVLEPYLDESILDKPTFSNWLNPTTKLQP